MNVTVRKSRPTGLAQRAIASLPSRLQQQLSEGDRQSLISTLEALEKQSEHLDYLPVFGYLSLRSDNYRELGKASQDEVVVGEDVVQATLPGHGLDFVISTVFRGTPEHPGVVAGLSAREDVDTPGVLLKVPKTVRCLAAILEREFFAESDLQDSENRSNCQYRPFLRTVQLKDGREVIALTFLTNPESVKALSHRQVVNPRLLAWLFTAQGGFYSKGGDGCLRGGACLDYWVNSYLEPRRREGQTVDPLVEEAIKMARILPEYSFAGLTAPPELVSLQKPEAEQGIVRVGKPEVEVETDTVAPLVRTA